MLFSFPSVSERSVGTATHEETWSNQVKASNKGLPLVTPYLKAQPRLQFRVCLYRAHFQIYCLHSLEGK
ncbi:hypothetical protein XELAEV_18045351mg [Xenopus laevis]|uniref:Uncharacterized protein n=1 Tax=Xenopus laevis TaxID=8355 RepID=A0A974H463_XENLA|nr:hypothetical protein XELAEV_18045351mg [Xenopus laevis]